MKYQVSFSWLTCYFQIHIKRSALLSLHKKSHLVQRCLWQQCLCQSNFDATSKWQTIDLPNWELFKYYWMLTCLLLNQKTSLRGILSSVDCLSYKVWIWEKAIHWSGISEIKTHIESKVKRTEKTRCSLVKYFFNTQREILYLRTAM